MSLGDSLGRRTSVRWGNGTSTQFAYEDDSDLDWVRPRDPRHRRGLKLKSASGVHARNRRPLSRTPLVFAGGATASAPGDSWMGIDYGYDASGRLTLMASTDSRIMGALPTAGSYGAANVLNQVAAVPARAAMTWSGEPDQGSLRGSDPPANGNLATDGRGWTYTHDGLNRLIRAQNSNGTVVTHAYDTDGIRMETVLNPTGSVNGMPTGGTRTRYVTSQTEEVADLDGNRAILRRYIPGPAIDERAAQVDANGAVSYIHTDRQSSVIALSDSAGAVTSRRV